MSQVLVTGGAGFIGSALARALLRRGRMVTVLDNLSTGAPENVPAGCTLVRGDVSQRETWDRLRLPQCDAVLHLAAQSSGEISHDDPLRDLDVNARGTQLALEWARQHGVRKFLFTSSMAVYGQQPGDEPVGEELPCAPRSFYGVSKLASEHFCRIYAREYGLGTIVFRLFNVYGPGQNLANLRQGMVSIYLAYYLSGGPIIVKGSLERFRDFIYVDDAVEACMRALATDAANGQILNLGTGIRTTVRQLLDALITAGGDDPRHFPIEERSGTPGDILGITADITRLTAVLGLRPQVPLSAGLRSMLEWARGQTIGNRAV